MISPKLQPPRPHGSSPAPPAESTGRRRDRRRGALAGGLASLVALALAIALRDASGAVSFLDAAAEAMLDVLPLRIFSALLAVFGTAAKAWLLIGLLAAVVLAGVAAGRAFAGATAGSRRVEWPRGLAVAMVAWIALALLILWRYGGETGGPLSGTRPVGVLFVLTLVVLAFGLALPLALAGLRRLDPPPLATGQVLSRRRFLIWTGLGVAGAAALLVLARDVARVSRGSQIGGASGRLPEPITPIDDFYVVSKNFRDPDPDRDGDWTVEVAGAVETTLTLSRDDLAALAGPVPFEFVSTLTCISNPVGGPLISTARWTGVPLAAVLGAVGVSVDEGDVVFHGHDGYADSIPLAKALASETALVWAMNGETLPRAHGYPLRAIVPGRYGIKNVKWIARISIETSGFEGYWQRRGWTDDATVKTMSRIDVPADKSIASRSQSVASGLAGIAFAGDRDIARVEISLDGGETWQAATVVERPGPLAWVLWRLPWQPTTGTHRLLVRATDGFGALQTVERVDPLPDGASGWHEIVAGVA
jgi:DMSO/TMAO reductase YedYZ molybdopterin-dependent catalytic subunit